MGKHKHAKKASKKVSKKLKTHSLPSGVQKSHKTDGSGKIQKSKSTPVADADVSIASSSSPSPTNRSSLGGPSPGSDQRQDTNPRRVSMPISDLNSMSRNRSRTTDDIATARPTPLSPSFSKTIPASAPFKTLSRVPGTSITVPVDHKASGSWLANKLREVRSQAEVRPSFKAGVIGVDEEHQSDVDDSSKKKEKSKRSKTDKAKNKAKIKNKSKTKTNDTKDETKVKKERKVREPKSFERKEVEDNHCNQSEQETEIENVHNEEDDTASEINTPSPPPRSTVKRKGEKTSVAAESQAGHVIRSVESPQAAERRERKNEKRREAQRKKQAKDNSVTVESINGVQVHLPAGLGKCTNDVLAHAKMVVLTTLGVVIVIGNGLKRKSSNDMDPHASFSARLDGETRAIKRLREALPGHRVLRTTHRLFRDLGSIPSDMAVLAEVARETIVDLATSQVAQTIGGGMANDNNPQHRSNQAESLGSEIMRMVQEQKVKLEKLERDMDKARSEEMNKKSKTRADEAVRSNSERADTDEAASSCKHPARGESRESRNDAQSPMERLSRRRRHSSLSSSDDSDSDSSTSTSDSD